MRRVRQYHNENIDERETETKKKKRKSELVNVKINEKFGFFFFVFVKFTRVESIRSIPDRVDLRDYFIVE